MQGEAFEPFDHDVLADRIGSPSETAAPQLAVDEHEPLRVERLAHLAAPADQRREPGGRAAGWRTSRVRDMRNTKPAPSTSAMPTTSGIETCRPSWSLSNNRNAPAANSTTPTAPSAPWPTLHLRHHQAGADQQQQQAGPGERHDRDAEQRQHQHHAAGEAREDHRRGGRPRTRSGSGRRGTAARSGSGRSGRRGSAGAAAACASRRFAPCEVDRDALRLRRAPFAWRSRSAVSVATISITPQLERLGGVTLAASRTAFSAQSAFRRASARARGCAPRRR